MDLTSRRPPVRAAASAIVQRYAENGSSLQQVSLPFTVVAPLGARFSAALGTRMTQATGDNLESLSGFTDTRLTLGYARRLGQKSLTVGLGLNLPSGKQELSQSEFGTLVLMSQQAYDFTVSSLGQGFGIHPSITLAVPVGPSIVLGLGAAYRLRGGYSPIAGMTEKYVPGNETLLTTGLDLGIGSSASLSLDLTHAFYAADKLGSMIVIEPGSRTSATALFRRITGFNELRLLVLYQVRAKTSTGPELTQSTGEIQTVPNQLRIRSSYRMRISRRIRSTLLIEGRLFDETFSYPERRMLDLGLLPTYRVSREITVQARFIQSFGTISGFEAGAGLTLSL